MPLSTIPIENLSEGDLQRLRENGVPEGHQLDYKLELPKKEDRADFLADVSAMANASGGDILYGVEEERDADGKPTGVPSNIVGLAVENWDDELLRLRNLLRDRLHPRIIGFQMRPVPLSHGRSVLVVRIPRSVLAPHMISEQSRDFFIRHGNGQQKMTVDEIRQAFLRTASWMEQAEMFRRERIQQVNQGKGPTLAGSGEVFLHVVPLGLRSTQIDLGDMAVRSVLEGIHPFLGMGGIRSRLNFDGYLKHGKESYLQVFRNGAIESCAVSYLGEVASGNQGFLPSEEFVREVQHCLHTSLGGLAKLGIQPPLAVFLTLFNAKDLKVPVRRGYFGQKEYAIDRYELWFDGQVVNSWEVPATEVLKAIFDALWNASGWASCDFYNDEGKWVLGP